MSAMVSIIVPIYNVEKYLVRCIESILRQSYKNVEIILVDDGSPDNSPALCDEYASKEKKIRVIHKENGGLASARLAGFEVATGEYVIFIDSDDYIADDMIEKLVCAAENTEADLAMCGYFTVRNGKSVANVLPFASKQILDRTEVEQKYILPLIGNDPNGINIPGFLCIRLLKRNLIRIEFFESERVYYKEDHVFNLLYGDSIQKIVIVNEPMYYYCFNSTSLSNAYRKDKWKMYMNLYNFYQSYLSERNYDAKERLANYFVSSVCASVDNAVLSGKYSDFHDEIREIIEYHMTKFILNSINRCNKSQKITIFLLKSRMYRLLYYIRKSRLEK